MKESLEMSSESLPKGFRNKIKLMSKEVKNMSKKRKIFAFIRILIIIGCSIGLTIQIVELFTQFYKGMTVVTINYENKKFDYIPGITSQVIGKVRLG
jgi:ribosomal protein S19